VPSFAVGAPPQTCRTALASTWCKWSSLFNAGADGARSFAYSRHLMALQACMCNLCATVKWQRPRSTTHVRAHQPRCGALLVAYSSLPAKTPGAGAADWEAARFCKSLARPAFRFCASSRRNAVVASEAFWAAGSAAGCGAGGSDRSAASISCTCLDPRIAVCPRCAAPLTGRTTAAQGLKRHCDCARCCALESLTTVHVFRKDLVRPVHGVKWQLARRITTLAG